jgi:hypothetical protein
MQQENKKKPINKDQNQNTAPLPGNDKNTKLKEQVMAAHEQADKDIEQDADLSIHSPNDDLDEGETARLGEDATDII